MGYQLNFAPIWRDFDLLLSGLALGLVMAVFAVAVVGNLIGLVAAFAMTSRSTALRRIASLYVTVIRNLPIYFLMLVAFFVLPQQLGIRIDKVHAFVGTLSIYAGAYLTEVYRGALIALPKGLREAGLAIGLTESQTRIWVIIPVMVRNALPALSNNFISLFKDTSVAAAIAVPELTFYARQINNNTFRTIEVWSVCSLIYVAACFLIAAGLRVAERRLAIPIEAGPVSSFLNAHQWWAILQGVGMTLVISGVAIILGTLLGIGVALSLVYGGRLQRIVVRVFLEYVRGTPVFVLILACYYMLSKAGIQLTPFQAGLVALTVFCSSHVGENLRGALLALPKGQTEAAKAIGLTFRQAFVYVLVPQALRQALPAWVNTAVELVKASTLLAVIGVVELMLTTRQIIALKATPLPSYFLAGAIYFLICFSIERLGRYVERRIALPA